MVSPKKNPCTLRSDAVLYEKRAFDARVPYGKAFARIQIGRLQVTVKETPSAQKASESPLSGGAGATLAAAVRRSGVVPTKVPLFELVVLAVGFGLCRAWVVGSLSIAAGYRMFAEGPFQYAQLYLLAGTLAALAVAICAPKVFGNQVALGRLNLLVLAGIAGSLLCMGVAFAARAHTLLTMGFALCGATSALLQVMWGERFVRHSMYLALLASPAGAIVTALVMMLVPSELLGLLLYGAPLVSFLLLCANRGEAGSLVLNLRPQPEEAAVYEGVLNEGGSPISRGTFARLIASIGVFSLIGRGLDSFPAGSGEDLPAFLSANYPFLAIALVGVLFICLVLLLGKRFDTLFIYRLSLPIMVAGFVILTLFMDRFTVMSITVITVGYEFFDVLFWALLVGVVRRGGRLPVLVFGWGVASTYLGMALGTMLSSVAVGPITAGGMDVSVLSLTSILVLVVLVVLVLPEGTLSKASSLNRHRVARGASEDATQERCAVIAKRYDLTPRECDVLVFLARGRTLGVVARELHIAEGTARTHMGHIYAKLGVHKQQELIDLVDAVADEVE